MDFDGRRENKTKQKKAWPHFTSDFCSPLGRRQSLSCADRDGEEVDYRREDWDTEEGHVYTWLH